MSLRLHLHLPNYPAEKLDVEVRRIAQQGQQLAHEQSSLERELAKLRQAMVDEEGSCHFCEIAVRNLDTLDDSQWRIPLETMGLRVLVHDSGITVKISVPTVKEQKSVIAAGTSL